MGRTAQIRLFRRDGSRLLPLAGFLALLTALTLVASPVRSGAAGTDLRRATVTQKGRAIVFAVNPSRAFALSRLSRRPDLARPKARFLCVEMRRRGDRRLSRVCIGGSRSSRTLAGFARALPGGKAIKSGKIPVRVRGTASDGLTVSFDPGRAHVTPGRYSWRVIFSTGACGPASFDCRSSYPGSGFADYRVRPVAVVGCTGGNGQVVRSGPRARRQVALTFDDGPSSYTPEILKILRRKNVRATFFMLGSQVSADPATARRVLAAGHEIANHSTSHALLPGYDDIRRASKTIRRVTGFQPCLFRPPYGALSSGVISNVRALRMKSVLWDVDTVDWSRPGTGAIRSRAGNAGRGSIVLMHDGGGPRSQTVAALPGIISNLRARGYRLVTVSSLLGNRFIYQPR